MPEIQRVKKSYCISTTFDNEIYIRLKEYSNKTSIPITKILDKAVVMYLDSINNKN